MVFQVGDKVVHRMYGLGEIVEIDEKEISGKKTTYYVVKMNDFTMWAPADESKKTSLRRPIAPSEFSRIKAVFKEQSQPLSVDRFERKTQLTTWMKDGALESLCRVVRDLTVFGRSNKLNDNDTVVLKHASDLLLDEWQFAMSIPIDEAEKELNELLPSVEV